MLDTVAVAQRSGLCIGFCFLLLKTVAVQSWPEKRGYRVDSVGTVSWLFATQCSWTEDRSLKVWL